MWFSRHFNSVINTTWWKCLYILTRIPQIHIEATFQKDLCLKPTEGKQLRQFSAEDCICLQLEASHLQPQPSSPKMEVVKAVLYLNDLQTSSQSVYHCLLGSQMPETKTIGLVNNLKKPDPSYKP